MTPFHRFVRIIAVPIFVCAGVMVLSNILDMLTQPGEDRLFTLILMGIAALDVGLGILLIRRVPDNVIGLLCAIYGTGYIFWGMYDSNVLKSYLVLYPDVITLPALFFLILYFPNGRLYPPRWSSAGIGVWLLEIVLNLFKTLSQPVLVDAFDSSKTQANLLYVPALAPLTNIASGLTGLLNLGFVILLITLPFLRYRHADERTRLQMRWLTFMALPMVLFLGLALAAGATDSPESIRIATFLISCLFIIAFPPISLGNAILRHRLYDIDIIIRRTLIYSILTAVLGAIYFGGVVLAQQIFKAVTGEGSDLAVVVSTLLIAALFSPLRRRIQQTIDRRFYRRKYDAEHTLARFNQSLRDEVEMDVLQTQLVAVVQETMQPDQMALWVNAQKDAQS